MHPLVSKSATLANVVGQNLHGIITATIEHANLGVFGLEIEMKAYKRRLHGFTSTHPGH
jgi:hypothetical protein